MSGIACSSKATVQATASVTAGSETTAAQTPDQSVSTLAPSSYYVCVDLANVRSGPGTSFPVVKQLSQGAVINVVRKDGDWYYLGQDDAKNDSYINQSLVCAQAGATTPAESPTASTPAPGSTCPSGCTEPPAGCAIKGNISAKTGDKLYYLQGDPDYDKTVIDPDYGERWFCTEAEAQANGWKHVGQ